ncbi:nucleoside phosphorylase [Limosilactobacillus sp. STM2_1]|uniref:Uridine phosphorylase n=1 Tax=Limosilactobacillus rudii TaxID=2759755 RepID=A0A7W3UL74_9LACO|nr:nucleoside phosphorylase [Limosilactobacillus rudii]MBB1079581.1 nucleoside phosphorylase [Limosilactobacillus rudii]MBB1097627.1 nucleoside phosphorylase [Limosilactobacillus rudii]MCD7134736.1 nucleoside phosphorylase [Limosilactobacillus rudii]
MTEEQQPHTQLTTAINTDSAVIVGDPARVDKAAKLLDEVQEWAFNREYKSVIGTYKGKRILIMSTGIGAPSAGIGVEELHNVNVNKVIRVGSAGAMQSGIGLGELIIGEGVVRDDGLTQKYVPGIYPAVPSFKLMALAHKYAPQAVYGIIRSHDGFYMDDNAKNEAFWSSKGIVGADMESGALMTIGRQRGMETLSILNNVVLYEGDLAAGVNDLVNGDDLMAQGETASLKLALDILSDHSLEED